MWPVIDLAISTDSHGWVLDLLTVTPTPRTRSSVALLPPMTAESLLSTLTKGSPSSVGPERPTVEKGRMTERKEGRLRNPQTFERRADSAGIKMNLKRKAQNVKTGEWKGWTNRGRLETSWMEKWWKTAGDERDHGQRATHLHRLRAGGWLPALGLPALSPPRSGTRRPSVLGWWPEQGRPGAAPPSAGQRGQSAQQRGSQWSRSHRPVAYPGPRLGALLAKKQDTPLGVTDEDAGRACHPQGNGEPMNWTSFRTLSSLFLRKDSQSWYLRLMPCRCSLCMWANLSFLGCSQGYRRMKSSATAFFKTIFNRICGQ